MSKFNLGDLVLWTPEHRPMMAHLTKYLDKPLRVVSIPDGKFLTVNFIDEDGETYWLSTNGDSFTLIKVCNCECGAKKLGYKNGAPGHALWCPAA